MDRLSILHGGPRQGHLSVREPSVEVEVASLVVDPRLLPLPGVDVVSRNAVAFERHAGLAVKLFHNDPVPALRDAVDAAKVFTPHSIPLTEPEIELAGFLRDWQWSGVLGRGGSDQRQGYKQQYSCACEHGRPPGDVLARAWKECNRLRRCAQRILTAASTRPDSCARPRRAAVAPSGAIPSRAIGAPPRPSRTFRS